MPADPARIATARQLLAQLGVTVDDLQDDLDQRPDVPTMAEYLPRVVAAAGPGAQRTYGTYWARMATAWGNRPLNTIVASDIEALQRQIAATAVSRRNARGGRHAGEHLIAAARAVYNRAIADGLLDAAASPAHRVVKPRRLPSIRRALTPTELDQINLAARSSGNDVILDALLLRLHTETACRRGGALALRLMDLDVGQGLVRLSEKGGTLRWQPITLDLAAHLADHARCRGAVLPTYGLLRYHNGQRLTSRRYDHLWKRLGEQMPWVATQGISIHWLRHTTLTWVERHFGYGIARAYAGHTDTTGPATTTYIKADLQAVATALAAMTGHPPPTRHAERSRGDRGPYVLLTMLTRGADRQPVVGVVTRAIDDRLPSYDRANFQGSLPGGISCAPSAERSNRQGWRTKRRRGFTKTTASEFSYAAEMGSLWGSGTSP